jgi:hypothetical protein
VKVYQELKTFCEKIGVLPISREVLPRDKNLAMKYRGIFKK